MTRAAVVVAAVDEARAIAGVVAAIPRGLCPHVIVVDGGSRDGTAEAARAAGAEVVVEPRRGYGRAMMAGARRARRHRPDAIVFLDGNGTIDGREVARLVGPVAAGEVDLVLGVRPARSTRAHQRAGNRLATWLLARAYGFRYADVSPARAIRTDVLDRLGLRERTYGWPLELQALALARGLRVREIPIALGPRAGRSKVSGTLRGSLGAGLAYLRLLARLALGRRT